jgi:hypothetical protein
MPNEAPSVTAGSFFVDYTLLPYSPPTTTANYISIVNGVTADSFVALQIFAAEEAEEVAPRLQS